MHQSALSIIIKVRNTKLIAKIGENFADLWHVLARHRREDFLFLLPINEIKKTPLDQFGMDHYLPCSALSFTLPSFREQDIVSLAILVIFDM